MSLIQCASIADGFSWYDFWNTMITSLSLGSFRGNPRFDHPPLKNIITLLTELQCDRVVAQYPYRDADYLHDYLDHLGNTFRDIGKDCVRFHFFRGGHMLRSQSAVEDINRIAQQAPHDYLGFVVIRPTGESCVGRTILQCATGTQYHRFVHVRASYDCHLLGSTLRVEGSPFMEQDGATHICAGAALWSFCYDLHRRYHTRRLFPRQVIELATRSEPIKEFGWGLNATQISQVLKDIGCANDTLTINLERNFNDEKKKEEFRDLIDFVYGYIQSNIPVLLGWFDCGRSEGHVVLVVGHDYEPSGAQGSGTKEPARSSNMSRNFSVRMTSGVRISRFRSGATTDPGVTVDTRSRNPTIFQCCSGREGSWPCLG